MSPSGKSVKRNRERNGNDNGNGNGNGNGNSNFHPPSAKRNCFSQFLYDTLLIERLKWIEITKSFRRNFSSVLGIIALSIGWYIQTIQMPSIKSDIDKIEKYGELERVYGEGSRSAYLTAFLIQKFDIKPTRADTNLYRNNVLQAKYDQALVYINSIYNNQRLGYEKTPELNEEGKLVLYIHREHELQLIDRYLKNNSEDSIRSKIDDLQKILKSSERAHQKAGFQYQGELKEKLSRKNSVFICLYVIGISLISWERVRAFILKQRGESSV